jgi:hypothetical protein
MSSPILPAVALKLLFQSRGQPWHGIRRALERLQVTERFDLNQRVLMHNELPSETRKTFNWLEIKASPQVTQLEKQP